MADPASSYTIETNTVMPIVIPGATVTDAGVMTAAQVQLLMSLGLGGITMYSNDGVGAPMRPAANAVGAVPGVTAIRIWNVSEKAPQYSDGVDWYDASGNLT